MLGYGCFSSSELPVSRRAQVYLHLLSASNLSTTFATPGSFCSPSTVFRRSFFSSSKTPSPPPPELIKRYLPFFIYLDCGTSRHKSCQRRKNEVKASKNLQQGFCFLTHSASSPRAQLIEVYNLIESNLLAGREESQSVRPRVVVVPCRVRTSRHTPPASRSRGLKRVIKL